MFFFFKQSMAYELLISDWSSDVCSSDLSAELLRPLGYNLPLETQRGYHIMVAGSNAGINRPVVLADRKVFVSPMRDGVRAAGTVEFGGLNLPPTRRRAQLLVKHFRSEEHTSELQSLMRISYAVFCLKKKKQQIPRCQNLYTDP